MWSWGSVIGSSTMSWLKNGSQVQQPPACGSYGSVSGYTSRRRSRASASTRRRGGSPASGTRPRPTPRRGDASLAGAGWGAWRATPGRGRRDAGRAHRPRTRRRSGHARVSSGSRCSAPRRSSMRSGTRTRRLKMNRIRVGTLSCPVCVSTSWVSTTAHVYGAGHGAIAGTGPPDDARTATRRTPPAGRRRPARTASGETGCVPARGETRGEAGSGRGGEAAAARRSSRGGRRALARGAAVAPRSW